MTIKIQQTAFEEDFDRGESAFVKEKVFSLINQKVAGLSRGLLIPDDLIAEAEKFISRNIKSELGNRYCPRCLKAHMMREADKFYLDKPARDFLEKMFDSDEERGHNGFYLDDDELIRI